MKADTRNFRETTQHNFLLEAIFLNSRIHLSANFVKKMFTTSKIGLFHIIAEWYL